jgi:hypothetical protein
MLPFETNPTESETVLLGTEETGTLRVKKYGKLGLNEYLLLKRYTKDLPDLQLEAVKLAEAIAHSTGKRVIDVFNGLTSGDTASLEDNLKEVLLLRQLMESDGLARTPALATVVLKYRVFPSVLQQDKESAKELRAKLKDKQVTNREELEQKLAALDGKISQIEGWGIEETSDPDKIHPELVEALASFASKEQNGWETPPEATEEDLKKLKSEEQSNPTGQTSIGESNGSGQLIPALPLNASGFKPQNSSRLSPSSVEVIFEAFRQK